MKNFKILSTTLVLAFLGASSLVFTSCERENLNQNDGNPVAVVNNNNSNDFVVKPNTIGRKVAFVGNLTGNIGSALTAANYEAYSMDLNSINIDANTGTLLVDVDAYNAQNKDVFWKGYEIALQKNLAVVLESGSKNETALVNFYNAELGGMENVGNINAVLVFQDEVGGMHISPIGKKYHYTTENLFQEFFTPFDEDAFLKEIQNSLTITHPVIIKDSSLEKDFVSKSTLTYSNISVDEGIRRAKGTFRNSSLSGSVSWISNPTTNPYSSSSNVTSQIVWRGALHDARDTCKGQQIATLGTTESFSKSFNIGLNIGPKVPVSATNKSLGEIAGGVAVGYSSSTVTGRTESSSLRMHKEYAEGRYYRDTRFVNGSFVGSVSFRVRCWETAGGRVRQQYKNVRINYTSRDRSNRWSGHKPPEKSANRFGWYRSGDDLPDC